jgi:Flp pilus assembly protein TadG
MQRIGTDKRHRRSRGVVLAEAAIVMMLLCLVTLGALQYGWFFYCLHTASNAARQGARVASVAGDPAVTCAAGTTALQNALFTLLRTAATTKAVTPVTDADGRACVQGQVIIPSTSPAVRLLPIPALPVPNCAATVIMAKEG